MNMDMDMNNSNEDAVLQKGGKSATIGEIRKFGGRDYIKTAQGWKFHGKGTGSKTKQYIESTKTGPSQQYKDESKSELKQIKKELSIPNQKDKSSTVREAAKTQLNRLNNSISLYERKRLNQLNNPSSLLNRVKEKAGLILKEQGIDEVSEIVDVSEHGDVFHIIYRHKDRSCPFGINIAKDGNATSGVNSPAASRIVKNLIN